MDGIDTLRPRWSAALEVGLLVALVAAIYLPRLGALGVRGEEPRRAQVAVEMIRSGDWIVPRQQGELYFSRPPLQNWAIGLLGLARGGVDAWAIRLPSVLATLGVVLLIYGYGRSFLSPAAAWVAAAAFASMPQVMELGRLGETDMMFTLFVSASLLLWHYGRSRGWSPIWVWTTAYLMVALGTLTKGPQAPVYFAATGGVYLLLGREWRDAFSWAHLAGIAVLVAVVGAWQIPYMQAVGWEGTLRIYGRNVAVRFDDTTWMTYVEHFFTYPFEILAGCLLPWSLLLVAYFSRDFRWRIGPARDHVLFLVCALAVTFPTVWFVPTARSRYFLPLYPCFALLAGLALDRCWQANSQVGWARLWRRFAVGLAAVMVALGAAVLAASLAGASSILAQPTGWAVAIAILVAALAAVLFRSREAKTPWQRIAGGASIALFLALTMVGVFTNSLLRRSEDQAALVAQLKHRIPAGTKLVSLGQVHHLFAYHFGEPIEPIPVPKPGEAPPAGVEFFCFHNVCVPLSRLDFPYETLAVVPCDRFRGSTSDNCVTVCRRILDTAKGSPRRPKR